MSDNNSASIDKNNNKLKKLLSFRGIFIVYNPKEFFRTIPFIGAILFLGCYLCLSYFLNINQFEILKYLIEKYLNIFPNLLGFSLGGYAIIVGFGNTEFIKKIAGSTNGSEYTIYEKLSSVFAFNLVCQAIVLIFSLVCDFSLYINSEYFINISPMHREMIDYAINCIMIFLGIWTLLIIPFLISNIFIFGQAYHTILKSGK